MSVLVQRVARDVGRAVGDFGLIEDGDRVMVAVSGGKDSYAMLEALRGLQRRAPVKFELVAVHLDQGQPGYDGRPLEQWLRDEGYDFHIVREDTYSVVIEHVTGKKTYCSLCSRLRRGVLYSTATALGCNRIALGHHRDDAIETLMLNLLFAGRVAAMPARLVSDDGAHVVIRPMIYCAEETLVELAMERKYPILPCRLCGSQDGAQRQRVKEMIAELERKNPGVKGSLFAALGNVRPTQMLDKELQPKASDLRDASGKKRGRLPVVS